MSTHRLSLTALVVVLAVGACEAPQRVALPPGPQVVEVEMADFQFHYEAPVSSGRVLFRVANIGNTSHSISLLPLSEDIPPIDQQLRGTERRAIVPLAVIKPRSPGTRTSFAVELAPGVRYAMVCFVDDAKGPHVLRGMSSEFRTAAPPSEPASSTSTWVGV